MYDKTKLSEYKFRAIVSIFLLCIISYLVIFHELRGPAIFEIGFIGGLFSLIQKVVIADWVALVFLVVAFVCYLLTNKS